MESKEGLKLWKASAIVISSGQKIEADVIAKDRNEALQTAIRALSAKCKRLGIDTVKTPIGSIQVKEK